MVRSTVGASQDSSSSPLVSSKQDLVAGNTRHFKVGFARLNDNNRLVHTVEMCVLYLRYFQGLRSTVTFDGLFDVTFVVLRRDQTLDLIHYQISYREFPQGQWCIYRRRNSR